MKRAFYILLTTAVIAFIIAFYNIDADARDRLFGEGADPVVIEAYANLERPTDVEFGLGLVTAWEGQTAVLKQRNGIIRHETCGAPLGCTLWVEGVCIIAIEQSLPPNVEDAILRVLYAQCAATP